MGKFKWLGTKLGIIKPDDDDDDDVDVVPLPQQAITTWHNHTQEVLAVNGQGLSL